MRPWHKQNLLNQLLIASPSTEKKGTVNIVLLYTYRVFLLPSLKQFSPLRDRVSKYTTTANEVHVHNSRVGLKYQTWNDHNTLEALGSVHQKGTEITKAAVVYGIPRTTLSDHVHGRVLPGMKSGTPSLLSSREEEELVEFLCQCADVGYQSHEVK